MGRDPMFEIVYGNVLISVRMNNYMLRMNNYMLRMNTLMRMNNHVFYKYGTYIDDYAILFHYLSMCKAIFTYAHLYI